MPSDLSQPVTLISTVQTTPRSSINLHTIDFSRR